MINFLHPEDLARTREESLKIAIGFPPGSSEKPPPPHKNGQIITSCGRRAGSEPTNCASGAARDVTAEGNRRGHAGRHHAVSAAHSAKDLDSLFS